MMRGRESRFGNPYADVKRFVGTEDLLQDIGFFTPRCTSYYDEGRSVVVFKDGSNVLTLGVLEPLMVVAMYDSLTDVTFIGPGFNTPPPPSYEFVTHYELEQKIREKQFKDRFSRGDTNEANDGMDA